VKDILGEDMNIIIMGPQGSGKGTQAKMIAQKYDMIHLSMGDLLRDEIARKTIIGKEAIRIMEEGDLIPDKITNGILDMKASEHERDGMIWDGYPRTADQSEYIKDAIPIDFVLELVLDDHEAIKRISARRNCPKCGAQYNLIYVKPANEDFCDKCHTHLEQRKDDYPDAIKKRLATYHRNLNVIRRYFDKSLFCKIDGNKTIPEVFKQVEESIDNKRCASEIGNEEFLKRVR